MSKHSGWDTFLIAAYFKNCPAHTQTHTCSANMGEWMQLKSLRLSCSTRSLMLASTTSTLFSWRSLTGSRVAMPLGLASANRSSSCVAVEMAWPGGSSLKDKGKWWRFLAWQCRLIWEMQENDNNNNNKKGQIFLNYSSDKKEKVVIHLVEWWGPFHFSL